MNPQRIVVTGSAGRIGRVAFSALADAGHDVVGIDRDMPPVPQAQFVRVDLGDFNGLRVAFKVADCVIHLAALADDSESFDFRSDLVPVNVTGTFNVLESARLAGIRRVMLASSMQVIDGYMQDGVRDLGVNVTLRPRYLYAATKVMLEALGQVHAVRHDMDILVVRFGWCPRDRQQIAELSTSVFFQDRYLSPHDAGHFFQVAVNAKQWGPERFSVVYLTSNPISTTGLVDLATARKLGYTPRDQWPSGAAEGLIPDSSRT